jgi:hypothetical protein
VLSQRNTSVMTKRTEGNGDGILSNSTWATLAKKR